MRAETFPTDVVCLFLFLLCVFAVGQVKLQYVEVVLPLLCVFGYGHVVAIFEPQIFRTFFGSHEPVVFKIVRDWLAENSFVEYTGQSIVVVNYAGALLIVECLLQIAHFGLDILQGVAFPDYQRQPAGRSMSVFIGVTAAKVYHSLPIPVFEEVKSLLYGGFCHSVKRKYVNVGSAQIRQLHSFDNGGVGILYLGKRLRIVLVGFVAYYFQIGRQPFFLMLNELVVVGAGHGDVHIIVPWDESPVTHGTEKGSCENVVTQIVLTAGLVDSF